MSKAFAGAIDGISVLATTTVVLAADRYREAVVLSNDSDETIYVAIGTAAVMNDGIRIPVAGTIVIIADHGAALAINAICTSGTKNLCVQTLIRNG